MYLLFAKFIEKKYINVNNNKYQLNAKKTIHGLTVQFSFIFRILVLKKKYMVN